MCPPGCDGPQYSCDIRRRPRRARLARPGGCWGVGGWGGALDDRLSGGSCLSVSTATHLIRDLEATRDETLRFFDLPPDELSRTYAPGKWSVKYILLHLADAETVLFDRIRRVLSEPRQVLWVFDQAAWAKGLDYSRVPLEVSRPVFESVRNAVIYYAGRYYETHGHLEFVHSETGVRTLRQEFDKVAAHNANHLDQIRAALSRR